MIPTGHRGVLLTLAASTVSHARLRLRHQVQEGLHRLSLLLQDSGQPPQHREQLLNVTVCHCGQDGICLQGAAALRAKGTGLSLGALGIVLASVILLICECPRPETTALRPTMPPPPCPMPPSPGGQPHLVCLPSARSAGGPSLTVPTAAMGQGTSPGAAG